MAGRPRKFDEQEIIRKAAEVFWQKGYEAASSEELLKAMGVGKGSFYLLFKNGKRELFAKALDQYAENSIASLKQKLEQSGDKVAVIKERFFTRVNDTGPAKYNGCYVGNTLVEMSNMDDEMKTKASQYLKELESIFCTVIKEALSQGQLTSKESPEFLARYLINLWNGMNITRRMSDDDKVLNQVVEKSLEILN